MKKNQKKRGSYLLRIAAIAVSVYMIVSLCTLWKDLANQKNTLAEALEEKSQKEAKIQELTDLLERGNENEIIEKAARERLGYVYADEKVIIEITGN